jgi:hypothetical protein
MIGKTPFVYRNFDHEVVDGIATMLDGRTVAVPPGVIVVREAILLRCVRCGRPLKNPQMLNGAPFGRICVRREFGL